jgi:tetratricopeptide (TPR) repeat protein
MAAIAEPTFKTVAPNASEMTERSTHLRDHFRRGKQHHDAGQYDQALQEYAAALELSPRDAFVLNNIGTTLGTLGRHEEALGAFTHALELRPGDRKILVNRGLALSRLSRFEEALECFDGALADAPADADTLTLRASALSGLRRHEDALRAVNAARAIRPHDSRIRALHEAILHEVLRGLTRKGLARWSGGKPKGTSPLIPITPGPDISDYVIEDRG